MIVENTDDRDTVHIRMSMQDTLNLGRGNLITRIKRSGQVEWSRGVVSAAGEGYSLEANDMMFHIQFFPAQKPGIQSKGSGYMYVWKTGPVSNLKTTYMHDLR